MSNVLQLSDLVSVGPATLKDFSHLGIDSVKQLAKQEANALYRKLCRLSRTQHDPCAEDVFAAAIAQAKNPNLPDEQKQWSYWSQMRKQRTVRCAWVPVGNTLYEHYHDTEWGVPVHEDRTHFEFLTLEGAQAGLSWETILKRRNGYAQAFAHFDWHKVAKFSDATVERLLQSSEIIRNRAKVESTVSNARCFEQIRKEWGSFDNYVWQYVGGKPLQPKRKTIFDIPVDSQESQALSKDLKKRGFRFVGSTIMYAHMQATGLVNDHTKDCFRFKLLA